MDNLDNSCSKTNPINSQLTNSQSQALVKNNSTFKIQHSKLRIAHSKHSN